MPQLKAQKVVATLPPALEADTLYFIRTGGGFDLYATNSIGEIVAYPLNQISATSANFNGGRPADLLVSGGISIFNGGSPAELV